MKRFHKMVLVSALSVAASGCSGLYSWKNNEVSESALEKSAIKDETVKNKTLASNPGIEISDKEKVSLSDDVIHRIPGWMSIEEESSLSWIRFNLERGISLEESLIRNGVSPDFLSDIKRSDYISLSTFYQGQSVWVSKNKDGSLAGFYTSPKNNLWYHVEITNLGPIVRSENTITQQVTSVYLTPDTSVESLSHSQKLAISAFLKDVSKGMSHETKVMLAKGKVKIGYKTTKISGHDIGQVEILRATSEYSDHIMTYLPE